MASIYSFSTLVCLSSNKQNFLLISEVVYQHFLSILSLGFFFSYTPNSSLKKKWLVIFLSHLGARIEKGPPVFLLLVHTIHLRLASHPKRTHSTRRHFFWSCLLCGFGRTWLFPPIFLFSSSAAFLHGFPSERFPLSTAAMLGTLGRQCFVCRLRVGAELHSLCLPT